MEYATIDGNMCLPVGQLRWHSEYRGGELKVRQAAIHSGATQRGKKRYQTERHEGHGKRSQHDEMTQQLVCACAPEQRTSNDLQPMCNRKRRTHGSQPAWENGGRVHDAADENRQS